MSTKVNVSLKVVNDLKIRDRQNNEVVGYCPACRCNDAHYNTKKLIWRCFHCNASGKVIADSSYEVAEEEDPEEIFPEQLDIAQVRGLYNNLAIKYHDNVPSNVVEYLNKRGLSQSTIDKFKIGFCSTDFYDEYSNTIAESAGIVFKGFPLLTNRITIPYLYKGDVTDIRGRIVNNLFFYREHTPTYLSLSGGHFFRGATYLFNHDAIDKSATVILTEGEFKAIVADQHGFPVVATPGIFGWQKEWGKLFVDKEVILAADSDKTVGMYSPAFLMAKSLVKEIPQLKVALLNWTGSQDKVDIDSLIISGNLKAFDRSIRGAIPAQEWLQKEIRRGVGQRTR